MTFLFLGHQGRKELIGRQDAARFFIDDRKPGN
jgi:hypothetical protein